MPSHHDLQARQKPSAAKPTPQDRAKLMIQRAVAYPSPQTLTPDVVQAMRESYGTAFVQQLMERSTAQENPPAPITESLDSFLANIQAGRAALSAASIQAKL